MRRQLMILLFSVLPSVAHADDDGDFYTNDSGPQYSDNSVDSAFREAAEQSYAAARDIESTEADVQQYADDAHSDVNWSRASIVDHTVGTAIDSGMDIAAKFPETEPIALGYKVTRDMIDVGSALLSDDGTQATTKTGELYGDTAEYLGGESSVGRWASGAAAYDDLERGKYGEALSDVYKAGGADEAAAVVKTGVALDDAYEGFEQANELDKQIDEHAKSTLDQLEDQRQEKLEQAQSYQATASSISSSVSSCAHGCGAVPAR